MQESIVYKILLRNNRRIPKSLERVGVIIKSSKGMKKVKMNPLELDKETIAKLDQQQLQEITGGLNDESGAASCSAGTSCSTGTSCSAGTSCNEEVTTA